MEGQHLLDEFRNKLIYNKDKLNNLFEEWGSLKQNNDFLFQNEVIFNNLVRQNLTEIFKDYKEQLDPFRDKVINLSYKSDLKFNLKLMYDCLFVICDRNEFYNLLEIENNETSDDLL